MTCSPWGSTNTTVTTATSCIPTRTTCALSTSTRSAAGSSWRRASTVAVATRRCWALEATDPSAKPTAVSSSRLSVTRTRERSPLSSAVMAVIRGRNSTPDSKAYGPSSGRSGPPTRPCGRARGRSWRAPPTGRRARSAWGAYPVGRARGAPPPGRCRRHDPRRRDLGEAHSSSSSDRAVGRRRRPAPRRPRAAPVVRTVLLLAILLALLLVNHGRSPSLARSGPGLRAPPGGTVTGHGSAAWMAGEQHDRDLDASSGVARTAVCRDARVAGVAQWGDCRCSAASRS